MPAIRPNLDTARRGFIRRRLAPAILLLAAGCASATAGGAKPAAPAPTLTPSLKPDEALVCPGVEAKLVLPLPADARVWLWWVAASGEALLVVDEDARAGTFTQTVLLLRDASGAPGRFVVATSPTAAAPAPREPFTCVERGFSTAGHPTAAAWGEVAPTFAAAGCDQGEIGRHYATLAEAAVQSVPVLPVCGESPAPEPPPLSLDALGARPDAVVRPDAQAMMSRAMRRMRVCDHDSAVLRGTLQRGDRPAEPIEWRLRPGEASGAFTPSSDDLPGEVLDLAFGRPPWAGAKELWLDARPDKWPQIDLVEGSEVVASVLIDDARRVYALERGRRSLSFRYAMEADGRLVPRGQDDLDRTWTGDLGDLGGCRLPVALRSEGEGPPSVITFTSAEWR